MTVRVVEDDFEERAGPYRAELLAHSYRMLASIDDAEDAVQETYVRAWRGYHRFEGRSSIRTWLYRIATNTCLRSLEHRSRRVLPTGLGGPGQDPAALLTESPELTWLEPLSDSMLGAGTGGAEDPLATVAQRQSVRLAFIAALQRLTPRQRAVFILREVLTFSAAEVADMLEVSPVAVNSLMQRARAHFDRAPLLESDVIEPDAPEQRELLDRYVTAMHANDVEALVSTLTEDAVWEMPPYPDWFHGARTIGQMIAAQSPAQRPGDHLLVPTSANGQPAFGLYLPDHDGVHRPFNLQVLTLTQEGISRVVAFFDQRLFAPFGLVDTAAHGERGEGESPPVSRSRERPHGGSIRYAEEVRRQ
ncbi:sigma-70 family RNA polymerase sigma factor [Ruania halotolerans]|uniref:sigma-70 family RNA polymerase sigma factor n=1 Tax=Ruania halotolerans TaxID=2897773 RepID=UPI001E54B8F0|nr:sigma-70 family RNA polymerase sigma factor [Ruania halotolerans]UFU05367.1 sigma-70 family RNA polymerase sigma factor [Ruania halotolerans]